ncbi:MAG: excinuclease ABC subunit UvrA [Bacteroidales bacterium]|jgi:excinuclease ABC subunit A|nr:excinuclease ABC subunit UvrA [Bacteroidales bacterium]
MKTNNDNNIILKGVRVNNLKNISLSIPQNKLIVITGVSGSGKSSLAFDTLFEEGQRRYVESLSSYARQFLGKMKKPEMDSIIGVPPAIAVQQRTMNRNPRSTVGTTTEIYEYLKLLYTKIGRTYSPISGKEVKRDSVSNVVDCILRDYKDKKVYILCPIVMTENEKYTERLNVLLQIGYTRLFKDSKVINIEDALKTKGLKANKNTFVLVDRLTVKQDDEQTYLRLSESVHTAFNESNGDCVVWSEEKTDSFSNRFEIDGMLFVKPSENFFSFNNIYGACDRCKGLGVIEDISEDLVITKPYLSVFEGCVNCWRGEILKKFKDDFIAKAYNKFPVHKPYNELTQEQKDFLWNGDEKVVGINKFFTMVRKESYKIQFRILLSRYTGRTICPDCHGTRLRKDVSYVKINDKSIVDLLLMPIDELLPFFENIKLNEYENKASERIIKEIKSRLNYLLEVGLGYLTLNRQSSTLSGGESQRIVLATSIGSPLIGSMYILDEPTIGLHSIDTDRLINVLKELRDEGNTVIVVEHDEEVIKNADYIIDIGPYAGKNGGNVVFQGTYDELIKDKHSLTAQYLRNEKFINLPDFHRKSKEYLEIDNIYENNIQGAKFHLPLNMKVVVCGVSGSGKTTIVSRVFLNALRSYLGTNIDYIPKCSELKGSLSLIKRVEMVDQNPIGKSSRSNPVSYIGAFDDIRNLFAEQPLAKTRGYSAGFFSFNVEGGRCEVCKGEGTVTISMQFMADVTLPCEECNGKRYKEDALEVKYKDKNIYDILNMTIDEAVDLFSQDKTTLTDKITNKLLTLQKVGLGYLQMGQPSSTVSGGEAQRIKLAYFLSKGTSQDKTLFIFDEPTTGLHFDDINKLNNSFDELIRLGHSVLIIEHHMDIIKTADYLIELGYGGGKKGGKIIFEGTPEELVKNKKSPTARFLKEKI